ncbi:hypothetical protein A6V29_10235 [Blastococcus sp. CCUG 61487]|nr:hypothetical protein A6V29_10235 [Blastococcus sp. CCUG 61487]
MEEPELPDPDDVVAGAGVDVLLPESPEDEPFDDESPDEELPVAAFDDDDDEEPFRLSVR